ncbi:MAG: ABC transporter permease, partial [Salinivirgaceae bacterium]
MKQFLFSFRIIKRSPMLAWVGVPGLAVGLAAVLLLISYLSHELSYDRHFTTKDRVVRISNRLIENNQTSYEAISLQSTLGKVLENVPGVEAGTRIYRGWNVDVLHEQQKFKGMELLYADTGFFRVFDQQLLFGDQQSALAGKGKVVLSQSAAMKIFGTTDCIGEIVQIYYQNGTVSGIIPDMPTNTHFSFDVLASIETIEPERFPGLEFYTYFLLNEDADFQSAILGIKNQNDEAMIPWCEGTQIEAHTEAEFLADIHLFTKTNNDLSASANHTYIYTVAAIALLILLIAIINYMNLYVLHGEKRIREIATRKSFGADKRWLIRLFYSDAMVMGGAALLLALFIVSLIHPYFAQLMGVPM